MQKLFLLLGLVLLTVPQSAQAQQVEEQNGTVTYTVADRSFTLCNNNSLQERDYVELLRLYTSNAIENELVSDYMGVYEDQNTRLDGQLDQVIEQQKAGMNDQQMELLYEPFQDQLSQEQFFKLHILNATSISTLLSQELGPEKAQTLCQPA
ncbi:MAG: hypothetical protein ACQEQL_04575 [Pseudomonadota bacterium]